MMIKILVWTAIITFIVLVWAIIIAFVVLPPITPSNMESIKIKDKTTLALNAHERPQLKVLPYFTFSS
jgi:Na+/H+-dicarboxylate symporter